MALWYECLILFRFTFCILPKMCGDLKCMHLYFNSFQLVHHQGYKGIRKNELFFNTGLSINVCGVFFFQIPAAPISKKMVYYAWLYFRALLTYTNNCN